MCTRMYVHIREGKKIEAPGVAVKNHDDSHERLRFYAINNVMRGIQQVEQCYGVSK